MMCFQDICS